MSTFFEKTLFYRVIQKKVPPIKLQTLTTLQVCFSTSNDSFSQNFYIFALDTTLKAQ